MEQHQQQQSAAQGIIKDQINQNFDIRRFLASIIISYWYIIILCVILALGAAFLYLRYTTPQYLVKSSLLLDGGESGGGSQSGTSVLKKIGIQDEGVNMFNEIMLLKSQDLIKDVVDSLDLNIRYWVKGKVKENEIYEECPIRIVFDSAGYIGGGDEFYITQARDNDKLIDGLFEITQNEKVTRIPFDSWTQMPFGRIKVLYVNSKLVFNGYTTIPIKVTILPNVVAVSQFLPVLQIFLQTEERVCWKFQ